MTKSMLFNTEMVRAILNGRKSCTRRIVKPQPQGRLCYTFAGGVTMALGDIRVNKRMKVGEMNTDSRIASQILN